MRETSDYRNAKDANLSPQTDSAFILLSDFIFEYISSLPNRSLMCFNQ